MLYFNVPSYLIWNWQQSLNFYFVNICIFVMKDFKIENYRKYNVCLCNITKFNNVSIILYLFQIFVMLNIMVKVPIVPAPHSIHSPSSL